MNHTLKKVALVTPVYNRRETTLQALRSLARINKTGLDVKIIVVDDGSTDGTSAAIRRDFPAVEIITGDGTLHYAAGTNRGFEAALKDQSDYIVAMNDDAIFHQEFLQRLIACAEQNPRSIVGALLLLWDEPHKVFQVAPRWNTWRGGWDLPADLTALTIKKTPFEVEGLVGNCLLYPRRAIEETGLMDEKNFPHGWGDIQYTTKMKKLGWRLLIEPRALVWCEPNTNPKPIHQLPINEALRHLLVNKRHPINLNRQLVARLESAPTKLQAAAAFAVYCAQLGLKTLKYGLRTSRHANS